jgi:hypothetical protein
MAAQNKPTYLLDADLMRNSEYTGTPFTDTESASYNARLGCNKAGSNAPFIGVATGLNNPSFGLAAADTAAHQGQHIGQTADATTTFKLVTGADVNNTMAYVVVDAGGAAADAVADVATGAVNRTGATVAENDEIWGDIPVA